MKYTFTKHPLFLAVFGIVLSSAIIPLVTHIYTQNKLSIQQRNRLCNDIIDNHTKDSQKLNNMVTKLELIVEDSLYVSMDSRKVSKQEMRDLYLDFDRTAWFWRYRVLRYAQSIGLGEERVSQLDKLLVGYKSNIVIVTQLIDELWDMELRSSALPDPNELQSKMKLVRTKLDALHIENTVIIQDVINVIME